MGEVIPLFPHQQRLPCLFFGWIVQADQDEMAHLMPFRPSVRADSRLLAMHHATGGIASQSLTLMGLFASVEPWPFGDLVSLYQDSGLTAPPSWGELQEYASQLKEQDLGMSDHSQQYQWLQEGFLPMDPDALWRAVAGYRLCWWTDPPIATECSWEESAIRDLQQRVAESLLPPVTSLSSEEDRFAHFSAMLHLTSEFMGGVLFPNGV